MSKYRLGADLERAAKAALEADGYYVIKSAGSKGIADLIALKIGEVLVVQCKLDGYLLPMDRVKTILLAARLAAVPVVAMWVPTGPRGGRTVGFVQLTGTGPADNRLWTADHAMEET